MGEDSIDFQTTPKLVVTRLKREELDLEITELKNCYANDGLELLSKDILKHPRNRLLDQLACVFLLSIS